MSIVKCQSNLCGVLLMGLIVAASSPSLVLHTNATGLVSNIEDYIHRLENVITFHRGNSSGETSGDRREAYNTITNINDDDDHHDGHDADNPSALNMDADRSEQQQQQSHRTPAYELFSEDLAEYCCQLGVIAGEKGFSCNSALYMRQIVDRNKNRAHNRPMGFYGPDRVENYGRAAMARFGRCLIGGLGGVSFHRCCQRSAREYIGATSSSISSSGSSSSYGHYDSYTRLMAILARMDETDAR